MCFIFMKIIKSIYGKIKICQFKNNGPTIYQVTKGISEHHRLIYRGLKQQWLAMSDHYNYHFKIRLKTLLRKKAWNKN